eukprot:scaffold166231_cov36-Tisochrysis_lutea.AAC.3
MIPTRECAADDTAQCLLGLCELGLGVTVERHAHARSCRLCEALAACPVAGLAERNGYTTRIEASDALSAPR